MSGTEPRPPKLQRGSLMRRRRGLVGNSRAGGALPWDVSQEGRVPLPLDARKARCSPTPFPKRPFGLRRIPSLPSRLLHLASAEPVNRNETVGACI